MLFSQLVSIYAILPAGFYLRYSPSWFLFTLFSQQVSIYAILPAGFYLRYSPSRFLYTLFSQLVSIYAILPAGFSHLVSFQKFTTILPVGFCLRFLPAGFSSEVNHAFSYSWSCQNLKIHLLTLCSTKRCMTQNIVILIILYAKHSGITAFCISLVLDFVISSCF